MVKKRYNYSDKNKYIWWSTGGAATRSVSNLLERHFSMNHKGEGGAPTHNCGIPEGKEDYDIILNIRNPYSWIISSFCDQSIFEYNKKGEHLDFDEYVRSRNGYDHNVAISDRWEDLDRGPNYFIKMEDILGSIEKIPCLKVDDDGYELTCVNQGMHKNDSTQKYREYDKKGVRSDWKKYYNQELADIIYNNPKMRIMFELGAYDKDSWK
jgi:hypothetical protein